ncbi:DUF2586 family protein [Plesiomonas shigelloides]|uniref:DUF2586 domain-containing protein n=1 Tax=Plesiomonas shigelloides TaxID=703 RepID=UPI001261F828|nr:DUF2586 domain-containing protein [Plesiomonas shigelloides]KAB7715710.1 DUF2586 family protein [Plesiomonas shigelloides]
MVWPSVTINQLNTYNGATKLIERTLLFVGKAHTNHGKILAITAQSNLDTLLGTEDSALKSNIYAFFKNAGQNAFCYAAPLSEEESFLALEGESRTKPKKSAIPTWINAVRNAQNVASVEGIVVVDAVTSPDVIQAAQELRTEINNTLGRWLWFALSVPGIAKETETWAQLIERLTTLQKGLVAPQVMLVPEFFGNDIGVLAGRLCNKAVTVADSPARVATGSLQGLKSTEKPQDSAGIPLELATLQALARVRYSVPMWYADYDGMYWADAVTLEAEGGDYDVIENVRVADKAARRIRTMAIQKIADRTLNSTPSSIASHEMLFGKPLREMAKSSQINGITFPGEIRPPKDGDVTITWPLRNKVNIAFIVRPYNCPKEISVGIMLDSELETSA